MKSIFVVPLLIFALCGYSQSKLPAKNAIWKYTRYNCQDGKSYTSTYSLTGVNQVDDTANYTVSGQYHFISVKHKWILKTDTGLFTLFDYNAKINDSLVLYRSDGTNLYGLKYKVKSIDSIQTSTSKIAKITLTVINTISGFGKPFHEIGIDEILGKEETYLSKIGSTRDFIPLLPFLATTCDSPNLCAYQDEDIGYEISKCEVTTSISSFSSNIIDNLTSIKRYLIYNLSGMQICEGNNYHQYVVDFNSLSSGLYIALFFNSSGSVKTLKIVK